MPPELPDGRPPANTAGNILQAGIEDDKRNFTRFFLIRKLGGLGAGREERKR